MATTSLNLALEHEPTGAKVLKRKLIVPEKIPSTFLTLSPVSTNSFRVLKTGNPAPTDASWKTYPPWGLVEPRAEEKMEFQSVMSPENAFLFGVAMWTPFFKIKG